MISVGGLLIMDGQMNYADLITFSLYNGLAGVHVEGHVVEDLRVVPLVGEGDVLHVDAALDVFQRLGVRLVGEVRLQAHQLREAGQQ